MANVAFLHETNRWHIWQKRRQAQPLTNISDVANGSSEKRKIYDWHVEIGTIANGTFQRCQRARLQSCNPKEKNNSSKKDDCLENMLLFSRMPAFLWSANLQILLFSPQKRVRDQTARLTPSSISVVYRLNPTCCERIYLMKTDDISKLTMLIV